MPNLTSNDILARAYIINQKISDLGYEYSVDLKQGKKCALKHRNELFVLQGVLDVLKCYKTLNNTNAIGTITTTLNIPLPTDYIEVTVNPTLDAISDVVLKGILTLNQWVTAISDSINSYQSTYTSTYLNNTLTITGPCDSINLNVNTNSGATITISDFTGGECAAEDDDNCYTEVEIQKLLDGVSTKYDVCFQPINFQYT